MGLGAEGVRKNDDCGKRRRGGWQEGRRERGAGRRGGWTVMVVAAVCLGNCTDAFGFNLHPHMRTPVANPRKGLSSPFQSSHARSMCGGKRLFMQWNEVGEEKKEEDEKSMQARLIQTVTLRRDLMSANNIVQELTTDDGIPVSELFDNRRFDWIQELLTTFDSRVLFRISDRMTVTIAWATYVTILFWWGESLAPEDVSLLMEFTIPGWPHELVGGFLSILLVFRTDQAYDRFWEGRRMWSFVTSECRDLARLTLANLDGPIADQFMAHIAAFPVALKQHLRGTKNPAEIAAVYNTYLPPNSTVIEMVTMSNNMPLTTLLSLSRVAAPLRYAPRYSSLDVVWTQLTNHVKALTEVISECEKIKCTPLPLSYSRHTSRFFSIFTLTLPFALIKETSPLIVPPIVAFVSWVLFVTDEIGHVIEDPFGSGLVTDPDDVGTNTMTDENINELYKRMDRDGSGSIEFSDLRQSLRDVVGVELKDEEAERIMARLDLNGDGKIDAEEFRQSWTVTAGKRKEIKQLETLPLGQYCDHIQSEVLCQWRVKKLYWDSPQFKSRWLDLGGGSEQEEEKDRYVSRNSVPRQIFDEIDSDSSGYIEKAELKEALSDEFTGEQSNALFADLDVNKDGKICWEEFQRAWSISDVMSWLSSVGFEEYATTFQRNDINGEVLFSLTDEDLKSMGIAKPGTRVSLLEAVHTLRCAPPQKLEVNPKSSTSPEPSRPSLRQLMQKIFRRRRGASQQGGESKKSRE